MRISARNIIKGRIIEVTKGATTAHVRIDIGGAVVTSSITNQAVDELAACRRTAGLRGDQGLRRDGGDRLMQGHTLITVASSIGVNITALRLPAFAVFLAEVLPPEALRAAPASGMGAVVGPGEPSSMKYLGHKRRRRFPPGGRIAGHSSRPIASRNAIPRSSAASVASASNSSGLNPDRSAWSNPCVTPVQHHRLHRHARAPQRVRDLHAVPRRRHVVVAAEKEQRRHRPPPAAARARFASPQ